MALPVNTMEKQNKAGVTKIQQKITKKARFLRAFWLTSGPKSRIIHTYTTKWDCMLKEASKFNLKEYNEFKQYTPLVITYEDTGETLDSDDFVDVNETLDYNITALHMNDFEYEDIQEILNIDLLRIAQCLAPHGVDFPEFNQPVKFDRNGRII